MKVLVLYGSRWGGTVAVAEKIGQVFIENGHTTDVFDAKKVPENFNSYDLCIIGSGIRADKWTKETLTFMEKNSGILQTKKTALFVSCQMADRKNGAREKAKDLYLQKTAEKYGLKPLSFGFFGGYMNFSKSHGLFVDILIRVNRKSLRKNGLDTQKVHDTRDWTSIAAWAYATLEEAQ